jgi:trans-aconitate methyltransferase
MMGKEQPASYYNASAANPEKYFNLPPSECCLYPVWRAVVREIPYGARVLDLGCGAGHLAAVAHQEGTHIRSWSGLDFAEGLIDIADRRRLPDSFSFIQWDAREWQPFQDKYTIVATDFFEHIEDDIGVIGNIPSGSPVIFSVPPHDHATHVRHFATIGAAVERYEPHIDIRKAERVGPSFVITGTRI